MSDNGRERINDWPLPEAGASWTVRYTSAAGLDSMLTLRGHDGAELMPKVQQAEKWLIEHGATPNGQPAPTAPPNNGHSNDAMICPIHDVPMSMHTKGDAVWWSHKAADGWCKGK